MTTLIAWIAVDQRRPSAIYLASDSRISWGTSRSRWDAARKLFFCRRHPDVFGFVGDALFPALTLGQLIEAADFSLLFDGGDDSNKRHAKFVLALKASFDRRHNAPDADFKILHASRGGRGSRADFNLWCLSFQASSTKWSDDSIEVSTKRSSLLAAIGSGTGLFTEHLSRWNSSDIAGTSRAIFGAFCDAIGSAKNTATGGVPQVVGMYHTNMPQPFGIVAGGKRYLNGFPLPDAIATDAVEWRDELFQRVDGRTLGLISGAQRHARPRQLK